MQKKYIWHMKEKAKHSYVEYMVSYFLELPHVQTPSSEKYCHIFLVIFVSLKFKKCYFFIYEP